MFYSTFAKCGVSPRIFKPGESELFNYNIGLADLVYNFIWVWTGILRQKHFDRKSFTNKVLEYKPHLVCFNEKEVARIYFSRKFTKEVNYGLQNRLLEIPGHMKPHTHRYRQVVIGMRIFGEM